MFVCLTVVVMVVVMDVAVSNGASERSFVCQAIRCALDLMLIVHDKRLMKMSCCALHSKVEHEGIQSAAVQMWSRILGSSERDS
jgi:hypothetical protein